MRTNNKLALYIILVLLLATAVIAPDSKPIAGFVFLDNGTIATNATIKLFINETTDGECETINDVYSGSDGSWVHNMNNLKKSSNTAQACSWSAGDNRPIWIEANGSTIINSPRSEGVFNSTPDTVADGTGLQYINNGTFPDRTLPNVTLLTPINTTVDYDADVTFVYNISDASTVSSCQLLFDNSSNSTDTSITVNTTNQFSLSNIADGIYNWSVNCTDAQNNMGLSETFVLNISKVGSLIIESITPNSDQSVEQYEWFNYTIQVTCLDGTCGNVNASLDPIPLPKSSPSLLTTLWTLFKDFFSGNLLTGWVTGALVPTTPGSTPFWTNGTNPTNYTDLTCLQNMATGDSCNVSWYVNASGEVLTTHEFFAYVNSTTWSQEVSNISEHYNISITETINPEVFNLTPVASTQFNVSETILIAANATDNTNISYIEVNITHPNGTINVYPLFNTTTSEHIYNATFTIPYAIGTYTLTYFANDTVGNFNQTESTTFIALDPQGPLVFNEIPPQNTQFNTSNGIQISANVTDDVEVNVVYANITTPNNAITQLALSRYQSTDIYNATYSVPNILGDYNVSFFANDTSNNINASQFTNFTAFDVAAPPFSNLAELPLDPVTYAPNQSYQFNITISDNINVSEVIMQFAGTNYTQENITNDTGVFIFNRTDLQVGTYSYTWYANDTSGNLNSTSDTYTVNQAASAVNLSLNTQDQNITIQVHSSVDIIATLLTGESTINLSQDSLDINQGLSPLTNTTTYSSLGDYNITVTYLATSNYSSSKETHFISVIDSTFPNVTSVIADPTPINQTQSTFINATIADNLNVDKAIAQVTFPNSTMINYTMTNSSSLYSVEFTTTLIYPIGQYNVTIFANDTSNNMNNTGTTSFVVNDVTNPNVTDILPIQAATSPINTDLQIAANVTDNIAVSTVIANITYPNSTIEQVTLSQYQSSNTYNSTFSLGALLGQYNITIFANDSSNNINQSTTSYFTALDITPPTINTLNEIPTDAATYSQNQLYHFNATITDDSGLHTTFFEFDGTNYTTSNVSTVFYFNISDLPQGSYSYTWFANDTSGTQAKQSGSYTINRATTLLNLSLNDVESNITVESGNTVNMTANRTAGQTNVGLYQNTTLINQGAPIITNTSTFTIPGNYNITANVSQSTNYTATSVTYFITVQDTTSPNVSSVSALPSPVLQGASTFINATITDIVEIQTVLAQVTYPNSTKINYTLTNISNLYSVEFPTTILYPLGTYNVQYFANDSSGNMNDSLTTTFQVNDPQAPLIFHLVPNQTTPGVGTSIEIASNITDNIALDTITVNITYPNSTTRDLTQTNVTGTDKFNLSFTIPYQIGTYNISWYANDTSGNINNSESTTFTAIDLTNLTVRVINPLSSSSFQLHSSILFTAIVEDDVAVDTVLGNLTMPNGTSRLLTLGYHTVDDIYNTTFTSANASGVYQLQIVANDTSNNLNDTQYRNFTVVGQDLPSVTLNAPLNTFAQSSPSITLNCSAADAQGITNITFYTNVSGTFAANNTQDLTGTSNTTTTTLTSLTNGTYLWNCLTYDTNENPATGTSNFTFIIDDVPPQVSSLVPTNGTQYNEAESISLNATVTDNIQVSTVIATVFFPNGTQENTTLSALGSNKYGSSYTLSSLEGSYNVSIFANDTAGNINNTQTTNFTIIATDESPVTTLISPANAYSTTTSTTTNITFSCNATDDVQLVNLSLYLTNKSNGNFAFNQTSPISGTSNETNYTTELPVGSYTWNCLSFDNASQSDFDTNRTLTISAPSSSSSSSSSGGGGGGSSSGGSGGGGGGFVPIKNATQQPAPVVPQLIVLYNQVETQSTLTNITLIARNYNLSSASIASLIYNNTHYETQVEYQDTNNVSFTTTLTTPPIQSSQETVQFKFNYSFVHTNTSQTNNLTQTYNQTIIREHLCGDSLISGNEQCDTFNLGDATCITQGFTSGNLSCTSQCTITTDACIQEEPKANIAGFAAGLGQSLFDNLGYLILLLIASLLFFFVLKPKKRPRIEVYVNRFTHAGTTTNVKIKAFNSQLPLKVTCWGLFIPHTTQNLAKFTKDIKKGPSYIIEVEPNETRSCIIPVRIPEYYSGKRIMVITYCEMVFQVDNKTSEKAVGFINYLRVGEKQDNHLKLRLKTLSESLKNHPHRLPEQLILNLREQHELHSQVTQEYMVKRTSKELQDKLKKLEELRDLHAQNVTVNQRLEILKRIQQTKRELKQAGTAKELSHEKIYEIENYYDTMHKIYQIPNNQIHQKFVQIHLEKKREQLKTKIEQIRPAQIVQTPSASEQRKLMLKRASLPHPLQTKWERELLEVERQLYLAHQDYLDEKLQRTDSHSSPQKNKVLSNRPQRQSQPQQDSRKREELIKQRENIKRMLEQKKNQLRLNIQEVKAKNNQTRTYSQINQPKPTNRTYLPKKNQNQTTLLNEETQKKRINQGNSWDHKFAQHQLDKIERMIQSTTYSRKAKNKRKAKEKTK